MPEGRDDKVVDVRGQDAGRDGSEHDAKGRTPVSRAWLLVVVIFLLAVVDLALRGWRADARLLLLAGVTTAALLVGQRAGQVVLGLAVLVIALYGWSSSGADAPVTATWAASLAVMFGSGVLVLWALGRLSRRFDDDLAQARQEARSLAKTVLDTRFDALQANNERLRRRTDDLQAALAVAQVLCVKVDVSMLLDVAVEAISEAFGFPLVSVYLTDEGGEWLTLRSSSTLEGKELALRGLRLRGGGDAPIGRVASQGQPLVMAYSERKQTEGGYLTSLPVTAAQSTATLPLRVDRLGIGVLDVFSSADRTFSADDLGVLGQVADCLALAIDNAQRLADGAAGLETTSLVYRTLTRLATARSERDVYETLLEAVGSYHPARVLVIETATEEGRFEGFDSAGIHHRSDTGSEPTMPVHITGRQETARGGYLRIVAERRRGEAIYEPYDLAETNGGARGQRGCGTDQQRQTLAPALLDVVLLGSALASPLAIWDLTDLPSSLSPELRRALEGLPGIAVVATGEAFRDHDDGSPWASTVPADTNALAAATLGALAFVPMRTLPVHTTGSDIVRAGVLVLYENAHPFSSSERQLYQVLSDVGGDALQRGRLVTQTRQQAEREAMRASLAERLRSMLDPEAILREALVELAGALKAERASIELSPVHSPSDLAPPEGSGASDGALDDRLGRYTSPDDLDASGCLGARRRLG